VRSIANSLLRRFRSCARGSATTSAHHSSVVGSCGCDHERLSTAGKSYTSSSFVKVVITASMFDVAPELVEFCRQRLKLICYDLDALLGVVVDWSSPSR